MDQTQEVANMVVCFGSKSCGKLDIASWVGRFFQRRGCNPAQTLF